MILILKKKYVSLCAEIQMIVLPKKTSINSDSTHILLKKLTKNLQKNITGSESSGCKQIVTYCAWTEHKNSVALVRKRTIPTERSPPVGEVSANFCG